MNFMPVPRWLVGPVTDSLVAGHLRRKLNRGSPDAMLRPLSRSRGRCAIFVPGSTERSMRLLSQHIHVKRRDFVAAAGALAGATLWPAPAPAPAAPASGRRWLTRPADATVVLFQGD